MATSYESAKVKCPFYKWNDGTRICCEGIEESDRIIIGFDKKNFKEKRMERFCNNNYEKCEVNKLINKKYLE